jgi:hypothetical protein
MVEEGHALAVMGNHELNALAYHTPDETAPGEYLRRHSTKNTHQHRATLAQLTPADFATYLNWFRTLPMWLDLDGLRVVHACWDDEHIATIRTARPQDTHVTSAFLHDSCLEGRSMFKPVEAILKGKEAKLPEGYFFGDKEGEKRTAVRTRWFASPETHTFATYALQTDPIECALALTRDIIAEARPYPTDAKPVFIGHYCLSGETPTLLSPNIACLDFSVAKVGFLCAYRWNGEQQLNEKNFVWFKR